MDLLSFCAEYLDHAERFQKSTYRHKQRICRRILKEWGADCPVEEITPLMVRSFLLKQSRQRTANCANEDRKHLSTLFAYAVEYLELERNPVSVTHRMPCEHRELYTPTKEEITKIKAVAYGQDKTMLFCYLYTAARRSEIFRLRWDQDIDLEGRGIRLGTRKNKTGDMKYTWLQMTEPLYESLVWLKKNRKFPRSPYVFVNDVVGNCGYGKPFTGRGWFLKKLCRKAGIKPFGFHALRRYVASELVRQPDVSLKDVQDVLRHSAIASTERYIKNIGQHRAGKVLDKI